MGIVYQNRGILQKSAEYLLKSLEMEKSFHGENSPGAAVTLHGLEIVYQERGNLQKAEEQLTVRWPTRVTSSPYRHVASP